jgi:hypothetical protein
MFWDIKSITPSLFRSQKEVLEEFSPSENFFDRESLQRGYQFLLNNLAKNCHLTGNDTIFGPDIPDEEHPTIPNMDEIDFPIGEEIPVQLQVPEIANSLQTPDCWL